MAHAQPFTIIMHVAGDQVTTGSGIFSVFFIFQLHVSDSLYSQALAFSQVPSGIAFNNNKHAQSFTIIMIISTCEDMVTSSIIITF